MISKENEYLKQATQTLYECNADELIRQQCRAREEYYKYQRTIEKALKDTTAERDQLAAEKDQLTTANSQLAAEKAQVLETVQQQNEALQSQAEEILQKDEEILRLKALLAKKH